MRNFFNRWRRDVDGASLVEYAILLGLILALSLTIISSMGTDISAIFSAVDTQLKSI